MEDIATALPGVQKEVSLSQYTTYKIGGPADYFFVAKTKEEVAKALALAQSHHLKTLILGGGSNLLVSDEGFDGLAVKVEIDGNITIHGQTIEAGAGISMQALVDFSVERGLAGLEWAGGLPGTFGGAIRGNAGAFGGEIKDSAIEVEALDERLQLVTLSNKECRFSYRSSLFKEQSWVVLSAKLQLKKGDRGALSEMARSHAEYRKERHPLEYGNSGSVFKNTPLSAFSKQLQEKFSHVVKKDPFEVVPTAFLISELGLKGVKIGKAQISEKHPNFLVNLGGAKAKDILALIDLIKKQAKKAFNVDFEVEVQFVPHGSVLPK